MRRSVVLLLIVSLPLIGAGCGAKKQSDAAVAKQWQKSAPPADYVARAKAMAQQGPMPARPNPGPAPGPGTGAPPGAH